MPLRFKKKNAQQESCFHTMNKQILNMLKIMSHDLRGSLVSISATIKLLNRGYYGKMDEGVQNKLNELFEKTIGLIGISEDFLGRAFTVSGDLQIEWDMLDLKKDIIDPVLEELSSETKGRNILIDNRLDPVTKNQILIKTNKIWLKTVFRNLLKNAIKYGAPECSIEIGFENHGSYCRLNVYNSGEPIPEEWRDKLFKKFTHIRNNNNGNSEGMGLGLYLIKKVIRKHGGNIWYEPQEHGSNFVFTIPVEAY